MAADKTFSHRVVIGASAGSIEALSELVSTLPPDFPAPTVIAQHLDPEQVNHLEHILSRRSTLPVRTVSDHVPLEAGVIFVVPSGHQVNITDDEIAFRTYQDVTAHREAEEALHESEERLRHAIEIETVGVIFFKTDGSITNANDAFLRMSGYSREDLAGGLVRWDKMTPSEWMPHSLNAIEEFRTTGRTRPYEKEYIRKDGSRWWALFAATRLGEEEGVEFVIDITESKRAEKALRESEERYRTLFESIDEGFCVVEVMFDADGEPVDYRFLETNPAFERHTGLREATGKRMRELAPDHEAHWFEIYGRVAETGESVRFVREAKALGGRWFDVYAFRLGGRESCRVAIVFNDVTERKRAEEALRESEELHRLIVESARDYAIFTTDLDGRIESWPPGAWAIFGWTSEEAIGQPVAMLFVPEDRASGEPEKVLATSREEDVAPDVRWHLRKDGSRVFIQGMTRYLRDARGLPRGFLMIGQDVTERKRAEEERERLVAHELTARAQTEERRRLSRELHDRVAHDMALVHQSLELYAALKESDPERAEAKLELAKATAKEALHSTRNLSMELRRPEVRQGLRAALSDLLQDVVPPSVDSRILVEGDEDPVPPDLRNQLFVILREAVRNAVRHSGCANIVVGLSISPERVVGYVEDDGRGFEAAESRWGGGIRSMRERTALAGAKLEISPAPNRGTKVMVSVPLEDG